MRFTFEGTECRIAFRHDRPRGWANHFQHKISFRRPERSYQDQTKTKGGPVELWCVACNLKLGPLAKNERVRNCHCRIMVGQAVVASGSARLNVKAGDHYNRELGREAALRAALASCDKLFRRAAFDAYFRRKEKPEHAAAPQSPAP
jgi:hypothetical protein